jgi:hypothetical protein
LDQQVLAGFGDTQGRSRDDNGGGPRETEAGAGPGSARPRTEYREALGLILALNECL